jgi:hypothetical protein
MAWSKAANSSGQLVSHTGEVLGRHVSYRFALDLTGQQSALCFKFAGARRFAFNHHIARAKANLELRAAQDLAGVAKELMETKTCSRCGRKKLAIGLSERSFCCEHCGLVIDRDLNAAINLARLAREPKLPEVAA